VVVDGGGEGDIGSTGGSSCTDLGELTGAGELVEVLIT
jgi:hypothetical protein